MTDQADRQEIVDLLTRYGSCLDRSEHDGWVDLFTEDGQFFVYGRSFDGREGLLKMAESAPGGLHLGGAPLIELDGDSATARQSFIFVDQATHETRIGWYDDVVVRDRGRWRIRSRRSTFLTASGPSDRP